MIYKCFEFIGPSPIDYDKHKKYKYTYTPQNLWINNPKFVIIMDNYDTEVKYFLEKYNIGNGNIGKQNATKHIDGQGRSIGGAILSSKNFYDNNLKPFIRHTGPTLSPINAWILLKSLETLNIRM